ncbi:MAG: TatD family hydrolase, partial [Bacillota bacterium]|nr:TatD family hydrolase [Bacillota bacterium]
ELKERFPGFVFAALGEHPEWPLSSEREFLLLVDLIRSERGRLSAIGEVGLPHYQRKEQKALVLDRLRVWASLSRDLSLPLALHAVYEGAKEVLWVLQEEGVNKAHFHWLKASEEVVAGILAAGYRISVTPEVCYRERARELARQVRATGLPLLFETDGPWPYEGPFGGEASAPSWLPKVIGCTAEALGEEAASLAHEGARAFRLLFGHQL